MTRVKILIAFVSCLLLFGCKSTRDISVVTHDQAVNINRDSCIDRETVKIDTAIIKFDSVSAFLPVKWINDTSGYKDPAPMTEKQGRATITIERRPGGIKVTASCDSLLELLVNRNHEIFDLHQQIKSKVSSSISTDKEVKIIYKTPLWVILLLVILLAIDVVIIVYKIKPRIL